jgi:thiosulfate dehydrogenase
MFKSFLVGFIVGVLTLVGGGYYYFSSGMAPAAVADPQMPFEKKMANMALDAHIEKENVGESPVPADETNLLAGADVYKDHCAACHGLPNQPPSNYSVTMFPKPTQLFHGKGVTDDPASESYWKAENGIRLSGMPAFKDTLTKTQLWQVSQLVANADKIPDSVKKDLAKEILAPSVVAPVTYPPSAH